MGKIICIFCASSLGNKQIYIDQAKSLSREIAKRGLDISYGGAECGLMGVVANEAIASGAKVYGVIPDFFKEDRFNTKEKIVHEGLHSLELCSTMAERKDKLIEISDAFVALPGSYGTMDEVFEILCAVQLQRINKKMILLNLDGFYDNLLAQLDRMIEDGFLTLTNRKLLLVANSIDEVMEIIDRI